jgi:hypothetical protein
MLKRHMSINLYRRKKTMSQTNPFASVGGLSVATASPAITQVALPAGYSIMQLAAHKAPAEKVASRKPAWECSVEELRERVTFRDVQAVSKRDPAQYHCRMFLAPRPLEMSLTLGNDPQGHPLNTIVCPAQFTQAVQQQLTEYVKAGHFDNALLKCAAELKDSKDNAKPKVKRAPVDKEAAAAALSELASTVPQTAVAGFPAAGQVVNGLVSAPTTLAFNAQGLQQPASNVTALPQGMVAPAGFPQFPA